MGMACTLEQSGIRRWTATSSKTMKKTLCQDKTILAAVVRQKRGNTKTVKSGKHVFCEMFKIVLLSVCMEVPPT